MVIRHHGSEIPQSLDVHDVQLDYSLALGRLFGSFGVSPLLGRLYGWLYLAKTPVSLPALCVQMGAAKSTVSVAIRRLEAFGAVERVGREGDRRDYYSASLEPVRVLDAWKRAVVQPELDAFRRVQERARKELAGVHGPDAELCGRISALNELINGLDGFVDGSERGRVG